MSITATTINYATKRNLMIEFGDNLNLEGKDPHGILVGESILRVTTEDKKVEVLYIKNNNGTFSFWHCEDYALRTELPAWICNEKELRSTLGYIAKHH